MKVNVQTLDAAAAGDLELNDAVFGIEPRTDILHRVVTWQLEKRRAPVFIGGGKAHGARVRDFNPSLNKKVRALGLKMALSSKAQGGQLIVIDNLDVPEGKTKALVANLAKLNLTTVLFIDGDAVNISFAKASANIIGVDLLPAVGANVYDILKADSLVLTRAAVEKLEARFNG